MGKKAVKNGDVEFKRAAQLWLHWTVHHPVVQTIGLLVLLGGAALYVVNALHLELTVDDFFPEQQQVVDDALLHKLDRSERLLILVESDRHPDFGADFGPDLGVSSGPSASTSIGRQGDRPEDAQHLAPLLEGLAQAVGKLAQVEVVRYRLTSAQQRFRQRQLPHHLLKQSTPDELQRLATQIDAAAVDDALRQVARFQHDYPGGAERLRRDPLELGAIALGAAKRLGMAGGGLNGPYFRGPSAGSFLFLVDTRLVGGDVGAQRRLRSDLQQVFAQIATTHAELMRRYNLRFSVTGKPFVSLSGFETVYRDGWQSLLAVFLLLLLLFALFFRYLPAALFALLPIGSGILLTLALSTWIFGALNIMALVFCTLLVGLGIDFVLHIAAHFRSYKPDRAHLSGGAEAIVGRLQFALTRPLRGIVFSALTSSVAFVALSFSTYGVVRQIGWLTAIGILAMLLAALLWMPLLLVRWSKVQRFTYAQSGTDQPSRWWWQYFAVRLAQRVAALHRRRRSALLVWLLLGLVAGFGLLRLNFEPHPWSAAVRGNPQAQFLENLSARLRLSPVPIVIVSSGDSAAQALANDCRDVRQLLRNPGFSGISRVESLGLLLGPPPVETLNALERLTEVGALDPAAFVRRFRAAVRRHGLAKDSYLMNDYPQRVAAALHWSRAPLTQGGLRAAGLGEVVDSHLVRQSVDGQLGGATPASWLAVSHVYLNQLPWRKGVVQRFLDAWHNVQQATGGSGRLLGSALKAQGHTRALQLELLRTGLWAMLLVGLLLFALFRRPPVVLRVLVPLTVSLYLLVGIMGLIGIELNFLTLAVLPILVGIGIDDGIHITERLQRRLPLQQALAEVVPGLLMTSLTTAAAFATLLFARFEGIHDFALCGLIGITLTTLSALFLLPLLGRHS